MGMPDNPTTKERVFFAAIRLFAKEGFKGATVREICKAAGTSNATAVNYYFGGKEKLYRAILDMIFAENMRRRNELKPDIPPDATPEERLRIFLTTLVDVGFSGDPLAEDATAIVLREMMAPSKYLDEMVESYTRTEDAELRAIIRDILGQEAPEYLVRDCLASVGGQVFYYLAFWPIFSRVNPDHPGVSNYKQPLVDHIIRFSMAGLEAVRQALKNREVPPTQP